MVRVKDGEVSLLSELFHRHQRPLFNYLYRLSGSSVQAEDLVQDVFFRILRYRETYRSQTTFTAWMYQVARNAYIDGTRRRSREAAWDEETLDPASEEQGADEKIAGEQQADLVRRALQELPADKREVLILSRYQNLKYEEIAEMLGCEPNTVKQRVFRAVRALSDKFQELSGGVR